MRIPPPQLASLPPARAAGAARSPVRPFLQFTGQCLGFKTADMDVAGWRAWSCPGALCYLLAMRRSAAIWQYRGQSAVMAGKETKKRRRPSNEVILRL